MAIKAAINNRIVRTPGNESVFLLVTSDAPEIWRNSPSSPTMSKWMAGKIIRIKAGCRVIPWIV
nr:hypothetical protein [uncultured Shinella sp.]